jgi:hypothetical protein
MYVFPVPAVVIPFSKELLNFESELCFLSHVETLHNFQLLIPYGYYIGQARG